MHTLTIDSLPKLTEELREHIDDPYVVFPHFMDDEQIAHRDVADVVRYVVMRCYLRSAPGMWAAYDGFVDVSITEGASEHAIFEAAVRRLARTNFPGRPHLSAWCFDSVERRPN